jgi:hypothetical protein
MCPCLGHVGCLAYFEEIPNFGKVRPNFGEEQLERKNMCKGKSHAKEESMQGAQAGNPNHVMVRVLVRDYNSY